MTLKARKKKEAKMKIGDRVQVWDDKNFICLGWGEVIGIGVGCKKGVPLVIVGTNLIWGDDPKYHVIPVEKVYQIIARMEKDLGLKK